MADRPDKNPTAHHRATRVLAVSNQKGGVGKTTTAINLGTALAAIGERVLIVDMDPQGNASTGLGVPRETRRVTIYDVVVDGRSVSDAAVRTSVPGLDIIPADADMSGVEIELSQADRRSYRLRDALRAQPGAGHTRYDYVLIDCPPSLNLLTLNAMAAADGVLVPLQCEFFALEGLTQLMKTIDMVLIYDLKCTGSQAYLRLAREVVGRERRTRAEMAAA